MSSRLIAQPSLESIETNTPGLSTAYRDRAKQNFACDLNDSNRHSSGRSEILRTHPCLSRQHSKVIVSLRPESLRSCLSSGRNRRPKFNGRFRLSAQSQRPQIKNLEWRLLLRVVRCLPARLWKTSLSLRNFRQWAVYSCKPPFVPM